MNIFITGGAGYVGSLLVPELLKDHKVTVYDLFIYGFRHSEHHNLTQIVGDIRDGDLLIKSSRSCDVMIHLASTAANVGVDEELAESIDLTSTNNIINACIYNKIKRLVVASSTSQYGIKPLDVSVDEDEVAEPVDYYGWCKITNENMILKSDLDSEVVFVRPSTLCGYAPRMRLDLAVNVLTINALVNRKILVFGGEQMRPTLNIDDMVRFYKLIISAPSEIVDRRAFNVLYQNKTIMELAKLVQTVVGGEIEVFPNDDKRSYHVNADRISRELLFECKSTLVDGINSVAKAYSEGLIPDALTSSLYSNSKRLNEYFKRSN